MIGLFTTKAGRLVLGTMFMVVITSLSGISNLPVPVASKHLDPSTSTLTLVLLNSTDGKPHYGQNITFSVSTSATTEPHVSLACSQNGAVVYRTETGYYASYAWPWTQTMTLSSYVWTGGGAGCTAVLYYFNGRKTVNLKTLNFDVLA